MLGLYLHIPFCQAICSYCNFNRGLFDGALKARYVSALEQEIRGAGLGEPVDTIFFGGGTPSLLEPEEIGRLIDACRGAYEVTPGAEVTLETNPETSSAERMTAYLSAGITRISFGAQSFSDEELRRLGRIHTADRVGQAVREARTAGVTNLSLDLMFWLPGQSKPSWLDTVNRAIDLAPDHLSLYLLELYPNAPLKEAMTRERASDLPEADRWTQSTDDEAADMYLEALSQLDGAGFAQYEISNVSRPGRESRHNLKYWEGGDWRGFGCGAHSTVDGQRWYNVASTGDYVDRMACQRPVALGLQQLSSTARIGEALFTGLRLTKGIDRHGFEQRYGVDPWVAHREALSGPVEAGLVWVRREAFGLTRPGMLLANEILTAFV